MTDAAASLGPITEARFAAAFANDATITAQAACGLLGLDPKTLRALTDALAIRAVRAGAKARRYTERDLRAYLLESEAAPCRDREKTRPVSAPRGGKVVPFSQVR